MEPVLQIDVDLDQFIEVNGTAGKALMILFHGKCECENFSGRILPGAVDTQKEEVGKERILSARYILEGKDKTGADCRIFIENNGNAAEDTTTPIIYTDSKALKWLETARLRGTIAGKEGGVIISVYAE